MLLQTFMMTSGSLNIDIGSRVKLVAKQGDTVNIPPMKPYTLRNKVIIFFQFLLIADTHASIFSFIFKPESQPKL